MARARLALFPAKSAVTRWASESSEKRLTHSSPASTSCGPQLGVRYHPAGGLGGRLGVAGRNQHRASLGQLGHAAHSRRDHRQAGGERLEEHLGHALGPGHVQEHVAVPVEVPEPAVERHVAEQLGVLLHAGRPQRTGKLVLHGAVTAHHEPPAGVVLAQPREHLREQEGVLLGVEPADAEHAQIPVVRTGQSVLARCHVLVVHQRDDYRQYLAASIATGKIGPDGHERVDPAQRAPYALEKERRQQDAAAAADGGCACGSGSPGARRAPPAAGAEPPRPRTPSPAGAARGARPRPRRRAASRSGAPSAPWPRPRSRGRESLA